MKKVYVLEMVMAGMLMVSMNVFAGDFPSSAADSTALAGSVAVDVDLDLAQTTFENTCSKCHSIKRPLSKTKDRKGWDLTTRRMSSHHKARFGNPIPEENRQAIIEYLVANGGK